MFTLSESVIKVLFEIILVLALLFNEYNKTNKNVIQNLRL